jgi:hypothetical protein
MCALTDDKPAVVIDREPDQEKGLDPSGHESDARSVAGRRARMTDGLVVAAMSGTPSTLAGVPGVPPPLDFDPMPQVWRLVAAFGVVCGVNLLVSSGWD